MLTAKIPGFRAGAGFAFQVGELNGKKDSYVAAKVMLRWEFGADIGIVYLKGFLGAGAGGEYHFAGDDKGHLEIYIYVEGGIKGGIWFFGKRDIISLYANAKGTLTKYSDGPWRLSASARVEYSISLFVGSISGHVSADFSTKFGG